MQTIINPLVVSVGPTSEATITPVPMTHHGSGVKKVVAIAAMVAIPVAAPAIASSIAASGILGAAISGAMATTAGAVISSAIVGAGLGAITAKVTGGSVKAGAIGGAIAGGIGGYGARSGFGQATPTTTSNPNVVTVGNTSSAYGGTTTAGGNNLLVNTSFSPNAQNLVYTPNTGTALSNTGTSGSFMQTMGQGLSNVGQKVVSKITNPDTLANAVLQVGGAVASEAMVGTPDNAEEQEALETYKAELQALKEKDEAAFNQKMEAAKAHMVQAGYYDPNYLGLQSANQAAIVEARRLRDFERKSALRSGGLSQGERRRAALASGLNVSSAYDQGFGQGVGLQNQALTTATNLIPNAGLGGVNAASNYLALASESAQNERTAADKQKERIMNFFGGFNTKKGTTKKEDEAIEQSASQYNEEMGANRPNKDDEKNKNFDFEMV